MTADNLTTSPTIETFGVTWHCAKQAALFQRLCQTFPQTFFADSEPKPLALSVRKGLRAHYHDAIQAGNITKTLLKQTLKTYTKSEAYLKQVMAGTDRLNLQGQPEGEITESEKAYAHVIWTKRYDPNRLQTDQQTQPTSPLEKTA